MVAKEPSLRRDEALFPAFAEVGGQLLCPFLRVRWLEFHEACRLRHEVLLLDPHSLHDHPIRMHESGGYALPSNLAGQLSEVSARGVSMR